MKEKIWLNEVSFIRPILLVLLVSYHAFAPYCGAWVKPDGIDDVLLYKWIARFSYAFLLEGFIFISGYVFAFQLAHGKRFLKFKELFVGKFFRLIIPCYILGLFYYFFFRNCSNFPHPLYNIVSGIGHLWYLPCLFWLFLLQFCITRYISNYNLRSHNSGLIKAVGVGGGILLIIIVLQVVSILPIPFQLNRVCYYLLFFYGGGLFYQHSTSIAKRTNPLINILFWILFVALVFTNNILMDRISLVNNASSSILMRVLYPVVCVYLKSILAWVGIVSLYQSAVLYCAKHKISEFILKVGTCGYGVYLFHQFVLIHLYRQTVLPQVLGTIWLPWVSLIITIVVSVILTLLVRSTRFGRKYV